MSNLWSGQDGDSQVRGSIPGLGLAALPHSIRLNGEAT